MKHTFEQKVYYSDTDAYGVVWHGSKIAFINDPDGYEIELIEKVEW